MARWTMADVPSQSGRSAVVTGTGGLGYEDALALARAGGEVILAGRNPAKGDAAITRIRSLVPGAKVRFEVLDLESLASIAQFAQRLRAQRQSLDLLINNAAVMRPPVRLETADGFELQFGVNYLGHFALTGRLMPLLVNGFQPRVVTLSSIAARRSGVLDLDDLNAQQLYRPMVQYAHSKLACLMFALELNRRSVSQGWGVASLAAHPGLARTDLIRNAPGAGGRIGMLHRLIRSLFQPAHQGALPTLFAATAPQARAGGYYGPHGRAEIRGYPAPAEVPEPALDQVAAARLWQISEQLTGVRFEAGKVSCSTA